MARMYSRHKGKHGSKHYPIRRVPKWMKSTRDDVVRTVIELAKQKNSSAMIGTIMRDRYGIPDVRTMTGKNISDMMKANKVYPNMPEDMLNLLRHAVSMRDHLKRSRKDRHSLRSLLNLESKIRRLAKYYKKEKMLPQNWTYSPEEARLIIQK